MKKKIITLIILCVLLYLTVVVIEFCCFYEVLGDDIWDFLKDFWDWYKTLFL